MQGKVALVTGASSGIGLSVAAKLVARGARVALVARTVENLERAVSRLGRDRAMAFPCDVSRLDALEELPRKVREAMGRLDILVNNAGVNHRGSIAKHSPAKLAEIVTTNLTAPIVLTRAAYDELSSGGSVVHVASIAGMVPVPGEATYSASKAGLRAFARASADDLAKRGVHSGVVSPGPVDTGFFGDVSEVADLVFSQPMSSADEVAEAVLRCIDTRAEEIAVPAVSGRLATAAYVFPALSAAIRGPLAKKGARAKAAYMAKKARDPR